MTSIAWRRLPTPRTRSNWSRPTALIILDPFDPKIIAEAKRQGISDDWLDACRRSPVYRMVKEWEIALPLHPEFRTLPSLFYIPPESPVATAKNTTGRKTMDMVDGGTVLPNLKEFRIPIEYLARLLAAGNTSEVEKALLRQLAVREFRRLERVEGRIDSSVLEKVGLTVAQARHIHRLLSLAHFHERFVIATARTEETKNAPYLERGFTGYDLMSSGDAPKRRTSFHGNKMGVGS